MRSPSPTESWAKLAARARLHPARRPECHRHAELRRDGHREIERTPGPHAARRLSVSVLIALALGWTRGVASCCRDSGHARADACSFYLYGYTLNRVTLFALIFSIGILVDDAIVVVENIVRHFAAARRSAGRFVAIAVRRRGRSRKPDDPGDVRRDRRDSADGICPRADGPLHAADPGRRVGRDAVFADVAFVVSPWASVRLLKGGHGAGEMPAKAGTTRGYRRVMGSGSSALPFVALWLSHRCCPVLLVGALSLVALRLVRVKMLPFDNKSEFQVIVDMPEGSTLEQTARVSAELARAVLKDPSVVNVQSYVGLIAVQLQRSCSSLLPASRSPRRRPAGQSPAERRAQRAEP